MAKKILDLVACAAVICIDEDVENGVFLIVGLYSDNRC